MNFELYTYEKNVYIKREFFNKEVSPLIKCVLYNDEVLVPLCSLFSRRDVEKVIINEKGQVCFIIPQTVNNGYIKHVTISFINELASLLGLDNIDNVSIECTNINPFHIYIIFPEVKTIEIKHENN
jgi:hypothetical protein